MRHSISLLGRIVGAGGMCLLPITLSVNLAIAQQKAEPLSAACNTTVTSGSGDGYMGICISAHGNVMRFEGPKGMDHMYADGYELVASSCSPRYYDFGLQESGWAAPNPPVRPGAPLPLTITRSTTDGKFKLVQKFTRNPTARELTIQMTVTNTSGQTQIFGGLSRYADFDADNTPGNDVIDETLRSFSVHEKKPSGYSYTPSHGVIATAITPLTLAQWGSYTAPAPQDDCLFNGNPLDDTPDVLSGTDVYSVLNFSLGPNGTMAKGTSKAFTMKYQLY